jgi:hypothetical protein
MMKDRTADNQAIMARDLIFLIWYLQDIAFCQAKYREVPFACQLLFLQV